jgi:GDP-mannose 6-dehydrogenase
LLDVDTPVLSSIISSNQLHIAQAMAMIRATGLRRVGMLGLSFKAGTDDLRESPLVTLAELLIGKGYELAIYDANVRLASLLGANREYILTHIPHIGRLLVDRVEQLCEQSEVIVLGTADPHIAELLAPLLQTKAVVDLVGLLPPTTMQGGTAHGYEGIAW